MAAPPPPQAALVGEPLLPCITLSLESAIEALAMQCGNQQQSSRAAAKVLERAKHPHLRGLGAGQQAHRPRGSHPAGRLPLQVRALGERGPSVGYDRLHG